MPNTDPVASRALDRASLIFYTRLWLVARARASSFIYPSHALDGVSAMMAARFEEGRAILARETDAAGLARRLVEEGLGCSCVILEGIILSLIRGETLNRAIGGWPQYLDLLHFFAVVDAVRKELGIAPEADLGRRPEFLDALVDVLWPTKAASANVTF